MKMSKYIMLAALTMAALACGSLAQAADLTYNLKATTLNGSAVTFNAKDIGGFECYGTQVDVMGLNSNLSYYVDTSNTLCNKLKALPNFASEYVQVPSTNRYLRGWMQTGCSGGQSYVSYSWNGGPLYFADGCQLDTLIKAKSIQ